MKRSERLSSRIIVITMIIFAFMLVVYVLTTIKNSQEIVKATIGERSISIAENMQRFIDVEKYKQLASNQVEDELYWELRAELNELREKNGVLYAYTYAVPEQEGVLTFLVDGMPADDTENAAGLGEESGSTSYADIQKVEREGKYYSDLLSDIYGEYISGTIPIKDNSGTTVAYLGIDIDASEVREVSYTVIKQTLPYMLLFFVISIMISLMILYRYINKSLRPLRMLTKAVEELSVGDIKTAQLTASSLTFKKQSEITYFVKAFAESLSRLGSTFKLIQEKSLNLEAAVKELNGASLQVNEASNVITTSVLQISTSSDQQKTSNAEVLLAMSEMATGIQRLADTTSDLAESSNEMALTVETSAQEADTVVTQIQNVEASVVRTADYVQEMGTNFKTIEEMVSVITNIADQTNLLALNAAIEAARAGEAGKGFAVVAEEVRKLAEMSRISAGDIHNQLEEFEKITGKALTEMDQSIVDVKAGSEAVAVIGQKLQVIMQSFTDMNGNIQDESAIIEQMSASSEEVLASVNDMNSLVHETTNLTKEVAAATDTQVDVVSKLNDVVTMLDTTSHEMIEAVEKFKL